MRVIVAIQTPEALVITLHHLENSQSIRILWLLEELGAPYEMKMYDRDKRTMLAPAAFKAVSPLGTAPVITEGEVTLAETNAIVDYILDRHGEGGGWRPGPGAPNRTRHLFWFHAAQGSLQPLLTTNFLFTALKTRAPWPVSAVLRSALGQLDKLFLHPRLDAILTEMERDLGTAPWFGGQDPTAADIVMGYCVDTASGRLGLGPDRYPNIAAFQARMQARPAYQRALSKDGKFDPNFGPGGRS